MEIDLRGECPICRSPLLFEARVACRSCRALHHRECWTYNGGRCAIYGCPRSERDPLPSLSSLPTPATTLRWGLTPGDWTVILTMLSIAGALLLFRL